MSVDISAIDRNGPPDGGQDHQAIEMAPIFRYVSAASRFLSAPLVAGICVMPSDYRSESPGQPYIAARRLNLAPSRASEMPAKWWPES